MNAEVFFKKGTSRKRASEALPIHLEIPKYSTIQAQFLEDAEMQFDGGLNPKEKRIYSRRVLWMIEALQQCQIQAKLEGLDPYRAGIYVAGHGHVTPWSVLQSRNQSGTSVFKAMKSSFFPKHGLKFNLGIAPGHISILFNIKGPTNAFINSTYSPLQAFEKANLDLRMGWIDLALVLCTNIFEDPHHILSSHVDARIKRGQPEHETFPTEAILCCIMSRPQDSPPDISKFLSSEDDPSYFGYLESLRGTHSTWWHNEP